MFLKQLQSALGRREHSASAGPGAGGRRARGGRAATGTDLAVAVACQLGDEAHVVVTDLRHLLADVVLGAAAGRRAGPPGGEAQTCHRQGCKGGAAGDTQDSHPLWGEAEPSGRSQPPAPQPASGSLPHLLLPVLEK